MRVRPSSTRTMLQPDGAGQSASLIPPVTVTVVALVVEVAVGTMTAAVAAMVLGAEVILAGTRTSRLVALQPLPLHSQRLSLPKFRF